MIVSAIFKAIIFYILFISIRGLIRAYGNFSQIKDQMKNAQEAFKQQQTGAGGTQGGARQTHAGGEVIEADYKVLD
jgi:hypothetical protein